MECGAFDGETSSNSLHFEKYRDWGGVLIEADPLFYAMMKKKNRKAFSINACLSVTPYPTEVMNLLNSIVVLNETNSYVALEQ